MFLKKLFPLAVKKIDVDQNKLATPPLKSTDEESTDQAKGDKKLLSTKTKRKHATLAVVVCLLFSIVLGFSIPLQLAENEKRGIPIESDFSSTPKILDNKKLATEIFLVTFFEKLDTTFSKWGLPSLQNLPKLENIPGVGKSLANGIKKLFFGESQQGNTSNTNLQQTNPNSLAPAVAPYFFDKFFSLSTFTPHISSPLIKTVSGQPTLFQASSTGSVYKIDPASGEIDRFTQLGESIFASPAVISISKKEEALLFLHYTAGFHLLTEQNQPLVKSLNSSFTWHGAAAHNTAGTLGGIAEENIIAAPVIYKNFESDSSSFIVATLSGKLFSFNSRYGQPQWQSSPFLQFDKIENIGLNAFSTQSTVFKRPAGFFSSPLLLEKGKTHSVFSSFHTTDQPTIIAADLAGNVFALKANDGKSLWKTDVGGKVKAKINGGFFIESGSPEIAVVTTDANIHILKANGEIVTSVSLGNALQKKIGHAVVAMALKRKGKDSLVVATQTGIIVRVDFSTKETKVTTLYDNPNSSFIAQPVSLKLNGRNVLLLADRHRKLLLLDSETPSVLAEVDLDYFVTASPAILDGTDSHKIKIFISGEDGTIEGFYLKKHTKKLNSLARAFSEKSSILRKKLDL